MRSVEHSAKIFSAKCSLPIDPRKFSPSKVSCDTGFHSSPRYIHGVLVFIILILLLCKSENIDSASVYQLHRLRNTAPLDWIAVMEFKTIHEISFRSPMKLAPLKFTQYNFLMESTIVKNEYTVHTMDMIPVQQ